MPEKARPIVWIAGATRLVGSVMEFDSGSIARVGGRIVFTPAGGGGGGAPTNAQYLTLALDGTLTAERRFVPTLPLSAADGGANGDYTLSLSGWSGTTDGDMLYRNGTAVGTKTASQVRSFLSLVVGTNVQAWDADLDTFAALASDGVLIRSTTWQIATLTAPLQRSGATLSVAAATTSAAGVVELATDGEAIADRAVQGNDSRLGAPGGAAVGLATWAGTGAGGDVTLDGTAAPAWATVSTIGGVRTYTVTASTFIELDTLTFDFGTYTTIAVVAKGAVFVVRTLDTTGGTGTIYLDFNGGNASGGSVGAGAAAVSSTSPMQGGQSGAVGRSTSGAGTAAGSYSVGIAMGGRGGTGGAAGGNGGGAGGTLTRDYVVGNTPYGDLSTVLLAARVQYWTSTSNLQPHMLTGGSGGGSGGNQVTSTSGAGGGGGGVQLWRFGRITLGSSTMYVRCNGGAGGTSTAPSAGGTGGGGGGGGGGGVLLVAAVISGTVYLESVGGNGGNGQTSDADVGAGGLGGDGGIVVCLYGSGTAPTGSAAGGTGGTGSGGAVAASGATGTVHIVSAVL